MKTAVIAVIVAVVALGAFLGVSKVRTYMAVGRETLVDKIDKALGEFKVKQTEIKTSLSGLDDAVKKMKEGQVTCEVQAEQLGQKLAAVTEKKTGAQNSLAKLRDLIAKNQPATMGGKTYSVPEMQDMADRLIAAFKSLDTQQQGISKAKELLEGNAKNLQAKCEQAKVAIAGMRSQLEETDAKLLALNTMRDAAKTAGGSDTLAESFTQTQDQINALYAKVETSMRLEEDAWKQNAPGAPVDVDSIVRATGDADATLSKIDEVLGKK